MNSDSAQFRLGALFLCDDELLLLLPCSIIPLSVNYSVKECHIYLIVTEHNTSGDSMRYE